MDYTAFLGRDPGAAFALGLFAGFLLGSVGFYLLENWLGIAPRRRDRTRPGPWTLDDRPLAVRSDVRSRIREDVRAWAHGAGVPPLRGDECGMGSDARVVRAEDAFEAREHERRSRFVRDLAARDLEIDELNIEQRH